MKYEIGSRLKYFRKRCGLSQKEFAKMIGTSNSRVSNWEHGVNRPDADILAQICIALQVSADEMLDIHIAQNVYTHEEQQIIEQYRKKPEFQQAILTLLGVCTDKPTH